MNSSELEKLRLQISYDSLKEIEEVHDREQLESFRIKYLGRREGLLNQLTAKIPLLPVEQRAHLGTQIKTLRSNLEELINRKLSEFKGTTKSEAVDFTTPGKVLDTGSLHPLTSVLEEVKEIFHYLGFSWIDGPEVETDTYNFQKLNMPPEHPARDVQQTYYLEGDLLLRTHTSNIQVRFIEKNKPPIRILSPGRVFRREMPDSTHFPSFHQIEGLLVDEKTSMTELLGSIDFFIKRFFGEKSKMRIYGHHFPYTEPSIEVEVYHSQKGWLEILGAGMVHPNVLQNGGLDPEKYQGFAFGMGIERLAMLKYEIDDIRILFNNDIRFLEQF